ncbi:hypothetical protein LY78DRAFT_35860 [Colletotrichum sublineola]|nr:hypothetical protein LY78DRAFT_35860 [Colletotrichum sublineola]
MVQQRVYLPYGFSGPFDHCRTLLFRSLVPQRRSSKVQAFRLFPAAARPIAHTVARPAMARFSNGGVRGAFLHVRLSLPPFSLQSLQQPLVGAATEPSKQGSDVTSDELFYGSFVGPSAPRQLAADDWSLVHSLVHSKLAWPKNQQRDLFIVISRIC